MSTLYELTGDYLQLMNMLYDDNEDTECILDTLEGVDYEIEEKANSYAIIMDSFQADVDHLDKEIKRLQKKKKTYENRIKGLKFRLQNAMEAMGKTQFKTNLYSFNITSGGGVRKMTLDVPVEDLPEEYRIKVPDVADLDKIRKLVEASGEDERCEFAHFEPRTKSLRIK